MYGSITHEQLVHILRSDVPGTCMPLIDKRLESLHTAGATLCQVEYRFSDISCTSLSLRSKTPVFSLSFCTSVKKVVDRFCEVYETGI